VAILGNDFSVEPKALRGIVIYHNAIRARVGAPPLAWNEQLAASAQAWANQCIDRDSNGLIDHNSNRSKGLPWYVGENIFASTGPATAQAAVNDWAAEARYYDYANSRCAAGKVCGHYTQLVWFDSKWLGCGISKCPNLKFHNSIVCDYAPGGNYPGQKPYPQPTSSQ
jgi:uncharacterized protein YkwD